MKLHKNQIEFLYAYFRQIDLSLDRARWTSWNEIKKYYKEHCIDPKLIIFYLENYLKLKYDDTTEFKIINKINKSNPLYLFTKSIKLDKVHVHNFLYLLHHLEFYLNSNKTDYDVELEQFRHNVIDCYYFYLRQFISIKKLNKLMHIEHYSNSEYSDPVSMKNFIPNDFE